MNESLEELEDNINQQLLTERLQSAYADDFSQMSESELGQDDPLPFTCAVDAFCYNRRLSKLYVGAGVNQ